MSSLYLLDTEYADWGLPAATAPVTSLVRRASALIDAYCHRKDGLGVVSYRERLQLPEGRNQSRLTFTPFVAWDTTQPGLPTGIRGRYGTGRRGDGAYDAYEIQTLATIASVFGGPPDWTAIDTALTDIFPNTGEVWVPAGIYQTHYTELDVAYTAGYVTIPDAVKAACSILALSIGNTLGPGIKMIKAGDRTIQGMGNTYMTDDVAAMLEPYRVRTLR
jgi:hypothetical protein